MPFTMNHSIHGRRLGLSTTGGVISAAGSTGRGSTIFGLAFQQWGDDMVVALTSTVASTLTNFGFTSLSSGTATALTFEIAAPVIGVSKEIQIDTSASEVSFGGTATDVIFRPSAQGVGSTLFLTGINLAGVNIMLRGKSATEWAVFASTHVAVIG